MTEKNYDPEQKEQVLTEMYQELKEKPKARGSWQLSFTVTVTEKAELIVTDPKSQKLRLNYLSFWILALDNGLIMFIMFCIMYTLLGVFFTKAS